MDLRICTFQTIRNFLFRNFLIGRFSEPCTYARMKGGEREERKRDRTMLFTTFHSMSWQTQKQKPKTNFYLIVGAVSLESVIIFILLIVRRIYNDILSCFNSSPIIFFLVM